MSLYQHIVKESELPWLPLDIDVPYQEMLEEANNIKHLFVSHRGKVPYQEMSEEANHIKHLFVSHRDQDTNGGYRNKGWKSYGDWLGTGTLSSKEKSKILQWR